MALGILCDLFFVTILFTLGSLTEIFQTLLKWWHRLAEDSLFCVVKTNLSSFPTKFQVLWGDYRFLNCNFISFSIRPVFPLTSFLMLKSCYPNLDPSSNSICKTFEELPVQEREVSWVFNIIIQKLQFRLLRRE